jgi:hypothetical protein
MRRKLPRQAKNSQDFLNKFMDTKASTKDINFSKKRRYFLFLNLILA